MQEGVLSELPYGSASIACPSCDSLIDTSSLLDGETAICPICKNFLTKFKADGIARVIAYTITALVLLALACAFPFLSFKAAGLESVMTLPGTAIALYNYGMMDLALLIAAFIILIPLLMLLLLLMLCLPLHLNVARPWLVPVGRTYFALLHWCMVDVFLIGVIVSLVKISSMATVVLGLSFFAYTGFAIFFTLALSSLDRLQCWLAIERVIARDSL